MTIVARAFDDSDIGSVSKIMYRLCCYLLVNCTVDLWGQTDARDRIEKSFAVGNPFNITQRSFNNLRQSLSITSTATIQNKNRAEPEKMTTKL